MSGLLEGLEAAIVSSKKLERISRIDAEFFNKRFLQSARAIKGRCCEHIANLANVSDGNHATISHNFTDKGVPYYRGKDATGQFFIEMARPVHITRDAYEQENMVRSHLNRGDVLLSIIGTIGEASLVSSQSPATCSCKLAILRPHSVSSEYLAVFLRTEHGQNQIRRMTRGAVQGGLVLEDMDQIWVPRLSADFENCIAACVRKSHSAFERSSRKQIEAENALLAALGLDNWTPPEPLSYTARAVDVFSSGRLDAQFFAPRVQNLINVLSSDGRKVSDVADLRCEQFKPTSCPVFNYIEIGGVDGQGSATGTLVSSEDAPSRAKWVVRPNDIITSTVRPIRRLSALIGPKQDGFVCSSGFAVVQPHDIAPEVLLTYLRLPLICKQLNLYTSASMYPAVTSADILNLPLPTIPDAVSKQVTQDVQAVKAARAAAANLLNAAIRVVEIAIEDGESAAMVYLDGVSAAASGVAETNR